MSMPNIPNINPDINLEINDSIKLLLNSLAINELGLSHIVNAEGEKLQYILGTLESDIKNSQARGARPCVDPETLINVNNSVKSTLREVLKNQMILQMKMEDTMTLYNSVKCNEYYECSCSEDIDILATEDKSIDRYNDQVINENYNIHFNEENDDNGIECSPIYF